MSKLSKSIATDFIRHQQEYARIWLELAAEKRKNAELTADYDRRTDQLNNTLRRNEALSAMKEADARIKTLEDALTKSSNAFSSVAECVLRSGGSASKGDLMEIYRICEEQAIAAKEPTA
jgi:hypothetical protein